MRGTIGWAGYRACWLLVGVIGCGDDAGPSTPDAGEEDSGALGCVRDDECSDGVFCNGIERCLPSHVLANEGGCVAGTPPRCDDGLTCTLDTCSHLMNGCRFVPIDADGDGHAAASCMSNEGEALGDDCDDSDANRFPGNAETCTVDTEDHDEDCNPESFGWRDADGDGEIDAACCNGDVCGTDCDDSEHRVGTDYPEICDEIDNDCDTRIDEDAISRPWYPDLDRDGFGDDEGVFMNSCAPVPLHSLFGTDCADATAAINPAALEICDGVDNDCDRATDEGDVCVCGVPGSEPCECTTGSVDCFGGLIPRNCIGGRWVAGALCSGLTPICALGRCVCADGGTGCTAVIDRSPPFILAIAPAADGLRVPTSAVVVAVLSEPPAASSVNAATFRVFDDNDVQVAGELTIDGAVVAFTPDALLPGHIYNVVIEDITDRAGNPMSATTSWRFATAVGNYPREVLFELSPDLTGGFAKPVLRVSPTGDAALWFDASWSCGDCVYNGSDVYQRTPNGVWTATAWPSQALTAPPLSIGAGGWTAAFAPVVSPLDLLRRGATDTEWNVQTTQYSEPAAVAVAGEAVVTIATTASTLLEVATASATAAPSPVSGLPAIGDAVEVAIAALADGTITALVIENEGVTAAHYANGTWNVRSAVAGFPSTPSVQLRDDGNAVLSWLQNEGFEVAPGGPSLLAPVQVIAFFNAASTSLAPISMVTRSVHSAPQVAWIDATSVMATHSEPHLVANLVSTNGTIVSRLDPQGRLGGVPASPMDLAVLSNGDAIATWNHSNSFFGPSTLVVARYVDGVWLPVEAIVESPSSANPQIEALPNNRALLTWGEQNPSRGVSIVLE